jgi:hypothetical protein
VSTIPNYKNLSSCLLDYGCEIRREMWQVESTIGAITFLFASFLSQIPLLQECMWRDKMKHDCETETGALRLVLSS